MISTVMILVTTFDWLRRKNEIIADTAKPQTATHTDDNMPHFHASYGVKREESHKVSFAIVLTIINNSASAFLILMSIFRILLF